MSAVDRLIGWSDETTLRVARTAQALVLHAADIGQRRSPTIARTFFTTGLRLSQWLVDDPARALARRYGLVQDLVQLHAEFAQRLVEVVAPTDGDEPRR